MLSYILLFLLISIVILGVVRASKQKYPGARPQKEPFLGTNTTTHEPLDDIETVGKPRIIRHKPTTPPTANTAEADIADIEEGVIAVRTPARQSTHPATEPETSAPAAPEPSTEKALLSDIIALHLLASPAHPYRGYELLQAILTAGLRHGKWNIFHRHEEISGRGPIIFSLASTVEPGTFDLAKISSFSTPGLTLFMRITDTPNPSQAFEKLLTAAQQLAGELGGEVCDERRLPLNNHKISQWRSQLQQMSTNVL